MLHVDPVTHLLGQRLPLGRVLHHLLAAGLIVLSDRDGLTDRILSDAELLLDTQLYRQTVRIPARTTIYTVSVHRLVAADDILDRARYDVVYARHSVGRGRTLVECKKRCILTLV